MKKKWMAKSVCMNIIEEMESYILKRAFHPHSLALESSARFSVAVYCAGSIIAHGSIKDASSLAMMSNYLKLSYDLEHHPH